MAPENSPTLGEFLRQERERRGITIEQVASATKISVRLLHLLESDNYVELPAKPFIRGFVNSYCRFVGLDNQEVLTRFADFIDKHAHARPTREAGHSGYAFERREGEQSRTILWIVLATFAVFGGAVYVFLKPSLHRHHGSHVEKLREANTEPSPGSSEAGAGFMSGLPAGLASGEPKLETAPSSKSALAPWMEPSPSPSAVAVAPTHVPSPTPSPSPSSKPTPSPKPAPSLNPSPKAQPSPVASGKPEKPDKLNSGVNLKPSEIKYKLVFRALDHVWVRYQVDHRPMMKFILRKGSILVLRSSDTVHFETSNPRMLNYSLNGSKGRVLAEDKNVAQRQADSALILPEQDSGTIENPFPGERSILGAQVPLPPAPR